MEQYTVIRAFRAGGTGYRRGDAYCADTPEKREEAALLARHGLIAREAEKGDGRDGEHVGVSRLRRV